MMGMGKRMRCFGLAMGGTLLWLILHNCFGMNVLLLRLEQSQLNAPLLR